MNTVKFWGIIIITGCISAKLIIYFRNHIIYLIPKYKKWFNIMRIL